MSYTDKKLNILELGKFYWPSKGGMETLLQLFCKGFTDMGHEVECVVSNEKPKKIIEKIEGVPVRREAQFSKLLSTSICPEYINACRRAKADIWHHHFPNPLADVACLLGDKKTPLILSYHSDIIRQAAFMKIYSHVMNRVLDRSQKIVVATPFHFTYSQWLQPYEDKVVVIPYGINLSQLEKKKSDGPAIEELREQAQAPIFLNVGRLVGYKGQKVFIQALKETNGTAWIVGQGPLEKELRELAKSENLENRVIFWGGVSEDKLRHLIHACDVFVFPSITPNEAFGLVQVEAMACSKPVIATNLQSGVPYVNKDRVTGLNVAPNSSSELSEAMEKLGNDSNLRAEYGRNAKERAFNEFETGVMLRRYIKLMYDLL